MNKSNYEFWKESTYDWMVEIPVRIYLARDDSKSTYVLVLDNKELFVDLQSGQCFCAQFHQQ
jgi:hypothetical protein